LIAIPLIVGGLILGSDLMLMLFGPEYISGTATFKVLLFTLIVVYAGGFIANAVLAFDSQKSFWLYLSLGLVSNIVLDFILIPILGIFGSALATVAAQILANAVIWRKLKSIQEFEVLRHLPKMLLAGAGMGLVVLALDLTALPVLAIVAMGAAAYILFLYLFKEPLLKYVPH
jgi:O-antigen/teichoic acid export membrane protein